MGDAFDEKKDGDSYQQGTSKSHQDAVQKRQSPIQRPLLVRKSRRPLNDQVQITPSQVPH